MSDVRRMREKVVLPGKHTLKVLLPVALVTYFLM
ncbi:hypothetical protein FHS13_002136 [Nocardiopsis algeriensis]|uniref:Uncharacterized protein n=1 Tax=Nocardiopsis algeriensis TaxID=1478215 RepID=A0A841IPV5_9ACTN|nr:hypothetical protein [Nocardiopsis algeriensis]